jgi:hypothetical protein
MIPFSLLEGDSIRLPFSLNLLKVLFYFPFIKGCPSGHIGFRCSEKSHKKKQGLFDPAFNIRRFMSGYFFSYFLLSPSKPTRAAEPSRKTAAGSGMEGGRPLKICHQPLRVP